VRPVFTSLLQGSPRALIVQLARAPAPMETSSGLLAASAASPGNMQPPRANPTARSVTTGLTHLLAKKHALAAPLAATTTTLHPLTQPHRACRALRAKQQRVNRNRRHALHVKLALLTQT